MTDYIYDIETYPNVFTLSVEHADVPLRWAFEISDWRNDSQEIVAFLHLLRSTGARMVGYNNLGFDYPVIHMLIKMGNATAGSLYEKAMAIIGSQDNDRWAHMVYPSDRFIEQIDLFKIHHFDNKARSTSLKMLEFSMRSDNIEDLPFPVGQPLTREQVPVLTRYNYHDVQETKAFYQHTASMLRFREELMQKYPGKDWLNFNDTKIGKQYFEMKLEEAGVQCYEFGPSGRQPRQTPRPQIHLNECILPWIAFEHPELTRVLNWLKHQTITETKGVFKDLIANVDGFEMVFGLGGIHGSIESEVVESDDEWVVIDLDVASYYPNLAITQHFYPEHLGDEFCAIYKHLYEQRKHHAKGTAENAMLKLALNGVYGDSNSRFSIFYDPKFTMSITLNGQLLLCMLAENLLKIPGLRMIQMNTDGLTVRVKREYRDTVGDVAKWWEANTGLELEEAIYSRIFIRDVNNYISEYVSDKVKLKGAYNYNRDWAQNHSALVVPKAAEKVLLEGAGIRESVMSWPDPMDFMLRTKVPRSSKLVIMDADGVDHPLQNITRYYIAKGGGRLFKLMPPTPKMASEGETDWRRIGVESGWGVQPCNNIRDQHLPIDYEYYIQEVEKLVLGLC